MDFSALSLRPEPPRLPTEAAEPPRARTSFLPATAGHADPREPRVQKRAAASRTRFAVWMVSAISVVVSLYFGREFFLPLALAGLLSFLLAPLVDFLERKRLPRGVAVFGVALSAFVLLGGLAYVIVLQVTDLAVKLPQYKDNLVAKAAVLKAQSDNPIARAQETLEEVAEAAEQSSPKLARPGEAKPVKVQMVPPAATAWGTISAFAKPLLAPLATAAVVIVLVIFMLLAREDVRDRLIHLAGRGRLRLTTEAIDEAGRRVSRYLIAETMVNAGYGIITATGLYFIGIPNAVLWGILAALLRFLPYIGPWMSAAGPILLSLAITDGWREPMLTCGLFITMELIGNNLVEPWVYGTSTGLAPLAIIISAAFWTWIWGPLGLFMATPLTVCVAVMAQHIPRLQFLYVLLGDKPPIATADRVYQRLLAMDMEEAAELVEKEAADRSLAEAFDLTTLAALRAAEDEFHQGLMPEENRERLFQVLRPLITKVGEKIETQPVNQRPVLCLPASDEADELAALMLQQSLRARGVSAEVVSSMCLISEMIERARADAPPVIAISIVSAEGPLAGVALCHRLHKALPEAYIVAGAWLSDEEESLRMRERLERCGSSFVCHTLERAVAAISAVAT